MNAKGSIIIIALSLTIVLTMLSLLTWAYLGSCDWIGRLNFEAPPVVSYPFILPKPKNNESFVPFAIVGDTQRTSFWECAIGREVNDDATSNIVTSIVTSKAQFLVHLGDMVFDGGNKRHWQFFDRTVLPWRETKLPILPVLGNHEYWGNKARARKYVEERFPEIRINTWYSKQNGNLGMIFLNSNHFEMSNDMWEAQTTWFKALLETWSLKDDIKGVMLFAHHPPYTNSVVVSSDLKIRSDIVKFFCKTKKAMVMVTGHAHGYERFENIGTSLSCSNRTHFKSSNRSETLGNNFKQSVQFVVSGGGGGPRPNRLKNVYNDAFAGHAPRPFNYLLVSLSNNGVQILTYGLQKGQKETYVIDKMTLEFPN